MFSPRESYIALEHYVDHITDVVASAFRTTKNELQAELTTLRAESTEAIKELQEGLSNSYARLSAAEEKIAMMPELVKIEAKKLFNTMESDFLALTKATPVNTPPAQSQDEKTAERCPRCGTVIFGASAI